MRFHEYIKKVNFTISNFDSYVYIRHIDSEPDAYLLLYMDDILITSKSKELIKGIKSVLDSEFEMKDLGEAKRILGIDIKRNKELKILSL